MVGGQLKKHLEKVVAVVFDVDITAIPSAAAAKVAIDMERIADGVAATDFVVVVLDTQSEAHVHRC